MGEITTPKGTEITDQKNTLRTRRFVRIFDQSGQARTNREKQSSLGKGVFGQARTSPDKSVFVRKQPLGQPGHTPLGVSGCPDAELSAGMWFHSFGADSEIEHQGHLLVLNKKGFGRAQLFEWFWGEPSKVITVTPAYLRACVFYTTCDAMNKAYAQWEAAHV